MRHVTRGGHLLLHPEQAHAVAHALIQVGIPIKRVLKRARLIRAARYRTLRGFFHGESDRYDEERDIDDPRLRSLPLPEGADAIGKTLDEVALANFGVEFMGIRRKHSRILEPSSDLRFEANDVVVLLGPPTALAAAEDCLLEGPGEGAMERLLESV